MDCSKSLMIRFVGLCNDNSNIHNLMANAQESQSAAVSPDLYDPYIYLILVLMCLGCIIAIILYFVFFNRRGYYTIVHPGYHPVVVPS